MTTPPPEPERQESGPRRADFLPPLIATGTLAAVSTASYLWFHSLVEIFAVVIGVMVYLTARRTFDFTRNNLLLCIAIGFFWSSLLDVPHTLTYEGMGLGTAYGPNLPTTLWLCARSLQVAALLLAPAFLGGRAVPRGLFAAFGGAAAVLAALAFGNFLPTVFIAGQGLTPFKIAWEWVLIFTLAIAAWRLQLVRRLIDPELYRVLILVYALIIAMETCFTLYVTTTGFFNMLGHLVKLWAYWLMLWVVTHYMLRQPRRLLQAQADMLSSVTTTVPGMVFQLRRSRNDRYDFLFASPGTAEIFELTPEALVGNANLAFERIDTADLTAVLDSLEGSANRMTAWRQEWRVRLPRKGMRWHRGESTLPVRRADGSLLWTAYIHDITADKEMAFELTQHRDQLARLVDERTEALRQALLRAEDADRAKSDFLSNMSHEIRTPLNAILGMAAIGLRDSAAAPAKRYLDQIHDSGQVLLALVNDILDIAKVEAGKFNIELRPVRLAAMVDRAAGMIAPRAESKGLSFELVADDSLPAAIMCDDLRLTQVLINLLGNAVKFTEKGYIRLSLIRIPGEQEWLLCSIEDSGIGMTEEQISRLFQPFSQGDASTSRRFGGTGLGLNISKHIVDLLGGSINVASAPNQGSCFTVRIPLHPADPAQVVDTPTTAGAILGPRLQGVRVIAAEDDPVNQEVLRGLLTQEGAVCRILDDGQAALAVLAESDDHAFDVFLCDIQMPGIDGYETARRATALVPRLPILGLTAYAQPEERARCLAAGMRDRVTKPIDVDALVHAIRRQIGPALAPAMAGAQPAAPPSGTLIDAEALFRRLGKPDFVRKVLAGLIEHHSATPDRLRQLAAAGDLPKLRLLAHSMRGVAANLSAGAAVACAQRLEDDILANDRADPTLTEALAAAVATLLAEAANLAIDNGERPTPVLEKD